MYNNDCLLLFLEPKKPGSGRRRSKLEKYRQEKAARSRDAIKGLNVADDDYYILIEVEELKYQLEVLTYGLLFYQLHLFYHT